MAGKQHDSEMARESLRKARMRATDARVAVLSVLIRGRAPLTHAEVTDALKGSGMDRATIFRNLRDLAARGLAFRSDFGDHAWRYEVRSHKHKRAQPTFICTRCRATEPLVDIHLAHDEGKKLPRSLRKRPIIVHVHGTCDACARLEKRSTDEDEDSED